MQRQVTKRQVQVIQPTINAGFMQSTLAPVVKKRVAAYARVSTEHEEQQTSYEAQVDYYTKKIKERTDWVFVEVYTDKGMQRARAVPGERLIRCRRFQALHFAPTVMSVCMSVTAALSRSAVFRMAV